MLQDVRDAVRALKAAPVVSIATILSLVLGIGAATAVFSVVDGVLLKPFPVEDQAHLLVVWTSKPERGFDHWPFSYASYEGIRERLRTTSGVGADPYSGTLSGVLHLDDGSTMPLERAVVTGDWFQVLGVHARAGRLLTAADDRVGAPHVIVLSSGMAERLFGSVGGAVGRSVRVQEDAFEVVGITPADFDYPRTAEVWLPAVWFKDDPEVAWDLVVRVAPGFTVDQTVSDLTSALRTLPPETGPLGAIKNQKIQAQSFANAVVGDVRPGLLMLAGAVLLMLIVAGVNVANLLLVRGLTRRRELSIRAAIGASHMRLVRQLVAEAVVLSAVSAVLAIPAAYVSLRALLALAPPELPRLAQIGIDVRALAFASVAAMVAAVVCGMSPALQTVGVEPVEALRAPDVGAPRGSRQYWLRHGLVMAQVAIATLVLSTAGLLLRSFDRTQGLNLGFAPQDILLAEVALPPSRDARPADLQRVMARLADDVARLPGASQVSGVVTPPFAGTQGVDAEVVAEGQPFNESASPVVNYEGVDSAYFATFGLPILRGRAINDRDRRESEPVVVVNQAFTRLFWPGQDSIGRRIRLGGSSTSTGPWRTVVGLVADTRYRDLTSVRPTIYVPYEQGIGVSPNYLAVRTETPATVSGAIRKTIAHEEPGATVVSVTPLPRLLAAPLARPRFQTALVASFALLGLVLSLVGTYGTLSFFVRQRRREIGIRMALGAAPSNVRRLVLRHGVMIGLLGVVVGTAAALAVSRVVQPLLFGVTSDDPLALVGSEAVVLVATIAATLLPTRLATRTDPLLVLRSE